MAGTVLRSCSADRTRLWGNGRVHPSESGRAKAGGETGGLDLVERWFAKLTSKRVRRGSFHSVEDLEKAIAEFLAAWNEHSRPFVWTATVESIKEKLSRCRQTLAGC